MPKNNYVRHNWKAIAFHKDVPEDISQDILRKFETGIIKTEKLKKKGDSKQFAVKISKGGRLICTSHEVEDPNSGATVNCLIALHDDQKHDLDFSQSNVEAKFNFKADFPKDRIQKLTEVMSGIVTNDNFIFYSKEQNKVAQSVDSIDLNSREFLSPGIKYYIVNGLAGSGKTTMAYDVLSTASMTPILK